MLVMPVVVWRARDSLVLPPLRAKSRRKEVFSTNSVAFAFDRLANSATGVHAVARLHWFIIAPYILHD